MRNLTFIIVLLLLSTIVAKAQQVRKPQPDSLIKIIPFGDGRYSSYLYTIGGKLQTREDVEIKLMAYAPSAAEVRAAKNNITWIYVSSAGFAITGLAATIEYAQNNKNAGVTTGFVNGQPTFIYQHHNLTGAYVLTAAASAFLISSVVRFSRTIFHARRAIDVYNQQFE